MKNFSKHIIILGLVISFFSIGVSQQVVLAEEPKSITPPTKEEKDQTSPPKPGDSKPDSKPATGGATTAGGTTTVENLLPSFEYTKSNDYQEKLSGNKIGAVNQLPKKSWQDAISAIIKILLNISGGLTLLGLTIGGTYMASSGGKADVIEKGKKIVIYSIYGLIVISISYALVIGVSELKFFT